MDMFKRELAPLSAKAWEEIESRAREVLLSRLSGRRVVSVHGPNGIGYTAISEGRLSLIDDAEVKSGVYAVQPLTEARIRFTLNKWELDNLERGAKDIDFGPMDSALEKLALFEEHAIYNGYEKGGIKGLRQSSGHKTLNFGTDANAILASVAQGVLILKGAYIHGPYSLVVGKDAWVKLNSETHPMSLFDRVEKMIGGSIVLSSCLDGALLIPYDDENLELTLGMDFSIGYESHDSKEVTLFATESFTFRVMEPKAVVVYK